MAKGNSQQKRKRKTLRFQIYTTIGLTFFCIAIIYSLILFSFERQRRETVIKKIELSIHAIFEQRQKLIANEIYLQHREAVELIIKRMLEIEGIVAIGVFNPDGSLFVATETMPTANLTAPEREKLSETHVFTVIQEVAIYTKPIIVIGETLGYVKIYYSLTDVVQETRWTLMIFSMLLLTILLAMAILLNTFLSRSVIRPVSLLIKAMRKVQEGRLGEQVVLDSENEIGEMAHTFNQMSAEKARIYQELDDLNKHLEHKVAERTAALQRKNITLNATLEDLRKTQTQLIDRSYQLEAARKEAELARSKAEAASQAKSEFLSHISHELRTPLNGIMGYAQILRRDKGLMTDQKDGLNVIYQCGNHLLTLINDILDLSKIEARRLELSPTEFRFSSFLEGIVGIIRMRAHQKNIEFVYEADHNDLPFGVYADKKRLRQVLLNLLGNAVKFTEKGSVIFKVCSNRFSDKERSAEALTTNIHFEVEDTGIGIAPAQLEKIFLPFEQVGESSGRTAGTGLGLAISHRLVELMGSTIQVKSEIGKGTIFWFDLELPIIEMSSETLQTQRQMICGYTGRRQSVLIVDDNAASRSMLINLLKPLGFDCIEASNGDEGIARVRETHPDAILIDLVMPGTTGFEVVQELRQIPDFKEVVIIAVSASIFEKYQQESLVAGCDAFLSKPVEAEELFALLETHLHIEWIYDDQEDEKKDAEAQVSTIVFEPSELIPLPPEEMEVLFELAMRGDMRGLQERASFLEHQDKTFRPLARKLYQLAKNFQDKQVLTLIEQYIENKP